MKKTMLYKFIGLAIVVALTLSSVTDLYGRGSRGGGSRSSSRSSFSRSSRSSSPSRSSSSRRSSSGSFGSRNSAPRGTSKAAPSKNDLSAARAKRSARIAAKGKTPVKSTASKGKKSSSGTSKALAKSGKVKGKTTQSLAVKKQAATKASMAKMKADPKVASQYKSTYATQPKTRPGHVPQTYRGAGGNTYNISYNSGHGGYGYMGPLGTWMMYDAMSDMAMYSYMSHRNPRYAYSEAEIERTVQKEADALIAAGRADEAADMLAERRHRRSRAPFIILGFLVVFVLAGGLIVVMSNQH